MRAWRLTAGLAAAAMLYLGALVTGWAAGDAVALAVFAPCCEGVLARSPATRRLRPTPPRAGAACPAGCAR